MTTSVNFRAVCITARSLSINSKGCFLHAVVFQCRCLSPASRDLFAGLGAAVTMFVSSEIVTAVHFANTESLINQQNAHRYNIHGCSVSAPTCFGATAQSSGGHSQFHLQKLKRHIVHEIVTVKTLKYTLRYQRRKLNSQRKLNKFYTAIT